MPGTTAVVDVTAGAGITKRAGPVPGDHETAVADPDPAAATPGSHDAFQQLPGGHSPRYSR